MKFVVISVIFFTLCQLIQAGPLRLQKRAAFYIANETACVVDATVYNSGDPIPTDDPCEACRCRPPGFACVLKECVSKPGCRAVRRAGQCCPEYICGCEHNGRMYRDGDEIRDSQNPCYTCHCQGSSIACAFVDCFFRVDCAPEYEPGECCPHYNSCAIIDSENSTNVDYAFSSEKTYSSEATSSKPEASESTIDSDISEEIAEKHVTKEDTKTSSEASPPESLDASLLFSVSEGEEVKEETETAKKDASTESVDDADSSETSLEAEPSEEISSEKKKENVTELVKSDFEIIKDEEKVKDPEITPEQGTTKVNTDPDNSEETDKNVEIFPAEESATVEVKTKTDPTTEVTVPVTVSITSEIPESLEDIDDKANELIKRFRSLKNLTSDDVTESPKEHVEVKADESNDATTKEIIEKAITTAVPEKLTTLKLEKEIVVGDGKSSDTSTEVSKHETLYYNSDDKTASETVETVTTVVEVKEQTSSEKVETSSQPVSKEPEQVITKVPSEVVEANIKQESTKKSNSEATSQATFEISDTTTTKVVDLSSPSSLQTETGKSEEKVQPFADDSETVASTEAPKETEVISSTTVVSETSSPKVEPSED